MSWFKSLFNKKQSEQNRKEIYRRLAIVPTTIVVFSVLSGCAVPTNSQGTPLVSFTPVPPSITPTFTRHQNSDSYAHPHTNNMPDIFWGNHS